MIINNTGSRFIGIPTITISEKNRIVGEPVDLPPGYSEVPDAIWVLARDTALDLIKEETLIEEWNKVSAKDAISYKISELILDAGDGDKKHIPATLMDIPRTGNKVIAVIKKTYDLKTLNSWYEQDTRQDVRIEIQNQINKIESGELKE